MYQQRVRLSHGIDVLFHPPFRLLPTSMVNATLVIRGGTVVDGTGSPSFTADIAIDGELIVAVGPDLVVSGDPKEINAVGRLVAPGWVDVHTHYDAQATWDPLLTPSAHCGVTTAIMGCAARRALPPAGPGARADGGLVDPRGTARAATAASASPPARLSSAPSSWT